MQLLQGGVPANSADLAALVLDELGLLEAELRGDATFQLPQYWNFDRPKVEEDCRDVLLRDLKRRMQRFRVDVQPEAQAAALKKMDMKATAYSDAGQLVTVPIEAKKDSHDELWTAWRDQLQRMYSIEPTSAGSGIYLVLWFGVNTTRSVDGILPASADQLDAVLRPRIDDPRLRLKVVDLSWPGHAKHKSTVRNAGRKKK